MKTRKTQAWHAACAGMLLLLLGGCALSSPSGESQFFLLSSPDLTSRAYPSDSSGLVVVGPMSFADYLKRNTIVLKQSAGKYDIAKLDQWGGRLEDEFQLALVKNLAASRPDRFFVTYGGMLAGQAPLQLKADIHRFDVAPLSEARLEVSWAWMDRSNKILAGGIFAAAQPAGMTLEQNIAAMSELVRLFGQEIAGKFPH